MTRPQRAVILPTPGDPYINSLWLSSYKKKWFSEVDKLYICLNSGMDPKILNYTKSLYDNLGCQVILFNHCIGHGKAIQHCLEIVEEENVLLLEDDFYILQSGQVNRLFEIVEKGFAQAVVSSRASCCQGLHQRIVDKFNLTGQEALVPNFWPCLFLSNKSHLLDTDQWFDSVNYEKGKYIPELDWTFDKNQSGDTFVGISIQLRNKKLRFHYEPQYRNTTDDLFLYDKKQGMFAEQLPWTHFGSSSNGLMGTLLDKTNRPLGNYKRSAPLELPDTSDLHIKEDIERRVSLWDLCFQHFPILNLECCYFNDIYSGAINKLIDECSLSREKIQTFKTIYREVLETIL